MSLKQLLLHKKISAFICLLLCAPILGMEINQEIEAAKEMQQKSKTQMFLMPLSPLPTILILKIGLAAYLIKI